MEDENGARGCSRAGFTLIEFIGALAILAILAAALIPNTIRQMDQAARVRERANLQAIADSLTQYIVRQKQIPNHTNWSSAIASEMGLSPHDVLVTPRGSSRAFLVDPNLRLGTNAGSGLAFAQTIYGSTNPANARIMLVSSFTPEALPVATGIPNATDFNQIWNTPEDSVPPGPAWSGWTRGDDLRIQRINVAPLFHRLILINKDIAGVGRFSIEGAGPMPVSNTADGWDSHYLDGTMLGLHDSNGVVVTKHILKRDISFVFEYGLWHGEILGGMPSYTNSAAFANQAAQFLGSYWNSGVKQGASQLSVLVAMYTFMFDYTMWATECPNFYRHGNTGQNPTSVPEYDLLNALGQNNGFLDKYSDDNTGLLK